MKQKFEDLEMEIMMFADEEVLMSNTGGDEPGFEEGDFDDPFA